MIALVDLEDPFDLDDEIVEAAAAPKSTRPRAAPRRRKRAPIARPPAGARCPHSTQPTADPRVCTQCLAVVVDRIVAGEPIAGAAPVIAPIAVAALVDLEPKPTRRTRTPSPTRASPEGRLTVSEIIALIAAADVAGAPRSKAARGRLRARLARDGIEPLERMRRGGVPALLYDRSQIEAWLKTRPARGAGVQP